MAYYPQVVQLAWDTVEKLIGDWRTKPEYWESEIDIQAELRSRLVSVYALLGRDEVSWVDTNARPPRTYRYGRVGCEPKVYYADKDGNASQARPDVVVWDDLKDREKDPGDGKWPILWACEIKYVQEPDPWDVEKLGYLLDQGRIQFGCWLTLSRELEDSQESITKVDKLSHGTRLWRYEAKVPRLPPP